MKILAFRFGAGGSGASRMGIKLRGVHTSEGKLT